MNRLWNRLVKMWSMGAGDRRKQVRLGVELLEDRTVPSVTPMLLADLNQHTADSSPDELVRVGDITYFVANDGVHGQELWRSDGTASGTAIVKDIALGATASDPQELVVVGGSLFFTADDGIHDREIWKSDGTEEGTVLVRDFPDSAIETNYDGGDPEHLTVSEGILFFAMKDLNEDNSLGVELWKTDGTEANTVLVKDIQTGTGDSSPQNLIDVNGTLFFTAFESTTRRELWTSDGTSEGTVLVKDLTANNDTRFFREMTAVGDSLFFRLGNGDTSPELWTSDGTAIGTQMLGQFPTNPFFHSLTAVADTLFFVGTDSQHGEELWKSDGTVAGTVLVSDIHLGVGVGSSPTELTNVAGTLFFQATDGNTGTELHKSDGTSEGTVLVADLRSGGEGSVPHALADVNGTLFFAANDGSSGVELYKSDGTALGTIRIQDSTPGSASTTIEHATNINGTLFFRAGEGSGAGIVTHGLELWKSDGSASGTSLVKDLNSVSLDADPSELVQVGDLAFFTADDGIHGRELWKTDGTVAGTALVTDLRLGHEGSGPLDLTNVDGTLYFNASDDGDGAQLWMSDGTVTGTVLVKDFTRGSTYQGEYYIDPTYLDELTAVGGTLFFTFNEETIGTELWKSDGTESGTVLVKDLRAGALSSFPFELTNVNGQLYFGARNSRTHLWTSDGTEAGTVELARGVRDMNPSNLVNVEGTLFFFGSAETSGDFEYQKGRELWTTDGTAIGTVVVKDIRAGSLGSNPDKLIESNGVLFFTANDGTHGQELWTSDGTDAGTVLVQDIRVGASNSVIGALVSTEDGVVFHANDGSTGTELWKSDGTSLGTTLVKDIRSGVNSSLPQQMAEFNGTLYFNANDGTTGHEFWQSDGTELGTMLLQDLNLGSRGSDPQNLIVIGNTLFFSADDGRTGRELWIVPSPDLEVDAGVDRTVTEGETVMLTGSFNDEAITGTATTLWQVLDQNGLLVAESFGTTLAFTPTDDGTYTATFSVEDSNGTQDEDSLALHVTNAKPVITSLTGPTSGVRGQSRSFSTSFTDAGSANTHTITWKVLDFKNTLVASGSGTGFDFTPTSSGNYTLAVAVTDDDGGSVNSGSTLLIHEVQLQGTQLVVGGTTKADSILLLPGATAQDVAVQINGVSYGTYKPFDVRVFAQSGNDTVRTSSALKLPTILEGGEGDDILEGGSGADRLVGQGGNDKLIGKAGFDLGEGGAGDDFADSSIEKFIGGTGRDGLTFEGTAHADDIRISWEPGPFVVVVINGERLETEYSEGEVIVVHAGAGNDRVIMEESGGLRWQGEFHGEAGKDVLIGSVNDDLLLGGSGRDRLYGGAGNDRLIGGAGNDRLHGQAGRDVLIGGTGKDRLKGGEGEDLLIGSSTTYDTNPDSLDAILREWTSDRSYFERVGNLRTGVPSSSGEFVRLDTHTVKDDGRTDVLTGGSERDVFFASRRRHQGRDVITDHDRKELILRTGRVGIVRFLLQEYLRRLLD